MNPAKRLALVEEGTLLSPCVKQALATVLDPLVLTNLNVSPIGLVQFFVFR
jgi:hypothetical protein